MKKLLIFAALLPLAVSAQDDDLYFTPKKSAKAERAEAVYDSRPAYYVGSNRSVDEYNRRGRYRSSYQTISADSLASDVISFDAGSGVYPDSAYIDTTFVFSIFSPSRSTVFLLAIIANKTTIVTPIINANIMIHSSTSSHIIIPPFALVRTKCFG